MGRGRVWDTRPRHGKSSDGGEHWGTWGGGTGGVGERAPSVGLEVAVAPSPQFMGLPLHPKGGGEGRARGIESGLAPAWPSRGRSTDCVWRPELEEEGLVLGGPGSDPRTRVIENKLSTKIGA